MAKTTTLMEWLDQTKKLSKEEDYMGLAIIDEVMTHLHAMCPEILRKHRKFFNDLCDYYHKDNPVDIALNTRDVAKRFRDKHSGQTIHHWQASFCRQPKGYPKGGCNAFIFFRQAMTEQIDIQIERFKKAQEVLKWQWYEVIDFMWERPELVNPAQIDDYTKKKINDVCADGKKKNPLKNGMLAKFGKFWKDEKGAWHPEKRHRF